MSQKRKRSLSPPPNSDIFQSSPITDRSSTFLAFFSPFHTAKELQSQHSISSATHKIAAWRKPSSQRALNSQPVLEISHDDDGEKYGGKTLEKVLVSANVEGAIVVARWYGGVWLGPVRFEHMKACAWDAIAGWRETVNKRRKGEDEAEIRKRLVRELPERDSSITVLRGLLAEKTKGPSSEAKTRSSPAKVPDYNKLLLPALQKLEQVRDATIAWILKEIEKAEANQAGDQGDPASATVQTGEPLTADAIEKPAIDAQTSLISEMENSPKRHEKQDTSS